MCLLNFKQVATSHFEDYICLEAIVFTLRCLLNPFNTHESEGYLFVCPPESFRIGPDSFRWRDPPAYWTLDSSGASWLRAEDARTLGFPIIHIETTIYGFLWDKTVYDELLDPDTEDPASHLGYPLFEVSRDAGILLACSEHNLHDRRLLYSSKV
ncbi:hypothetical protein B0H14DRAFT_2597933 [Mycena olivaceomarginata]|nr:hypothetical protein B0H14DRAFT_2597933 [Mycena olivaceomarginata]